MIALVLALLLALIVTLMSALVSAVMVASMAFVSLDCGIQGFDSLDGGLGGGHDGGIDSGLSGGLCGNLVVRPGLPKDINLWCIIVGLLSKFQISRSLRTGSILFQICCQCVFLLFFFVASVFF